MEHRGGQEQQDKIVSALMFADAAVTIGVSTGMSTRANIVEDVQCEDAKEIIEFWNQHIPILLSCRKFYCYFAISLLSENYGQIIFGSEPEFEEPEFVANDFLEFMTKLTSKTLDKKYLEQIIM